MSHLIKIGGLCASRRADGGLQELAGRGEKAGGEIVMEAIHRSEADYLKTAAALLGLRHLSALMDAYGGK